MTTATNTVTPIDFTATEQVCGSTLFPEIYAPGEKQITRTLHRHPDCQPSNPDYVPDAKTLRRVLAWYNSPKMKSLGLSGETGTGKTELALYLADKLNVPLYIVKVHDALMPEDSEGSKELTATDKGVITRNALGLAAKAYRNGGILLLDEVDKCNKAFGAALHGLLEGKPWPIEQFGVVINKHPSFRCMATANTMGEGGHERYHTSNRMDAALRGRFGWFVTHFPTQERELAILDKKFPKLPTSMRVDMIKLANAFRDALLGPSRDGKIDNPINAVFSTRTLVDWGVALMTFGKQATWRESLDFAFQGSIDPEYTDMADDIIQRILGHLIDETVDQVVQSYLPVKKS
jgi:cobaltochelatase CobS